LLGAAALAGSERHSYGEYKARNELILYYMSQLGLTVTYASIDSSIAMHTGHNS
jgi:hypothetical protein